MMASQLLTTALPAQTESGNIPAKSPSSNDGFESLIPKKESKNTANEQKMSSALPDQEVMEEDQDINSSTSDQDMPQADERPLSTREIKSTASDHLPTPASENADNPVDQEQVKSEVLSFEAEVEVTPGTNNTPELRPETETVQAVNKVVKDESFNNGANVTRLNTDASKADMTPRSVEGRQAPDQKNDVETMDTSSSSDDDSHSGQQADHEVFPEVSPKSLAIIGEFSQSQTIKTDVKPDHQLANLSVKDTVVDAMRLAAGSEDIEIDDPQNAQQQKASQQVGVASSKVELTFVNTNTESTAPRVTGAVNVVAAAQPQTNDLETEFLKADAEVSEIDDTPSPEYETQTPKVKDKAAQNQGSIPLAPSLEPSADKSTVQSIEALKGVSELSDTRIKSEPVRTPVKSPLAQNVIAQIRQVNVEPGTITIRLKPHGMGLVEFDVRSEPDGSMEVAIRAKNPMVLDALKSERSAIMDMLQQQGTNIKQDSLSFGTFSQNDKNDEKSKSPVNERSSNTTQEEDVDDVAAHKEQRATSGTNIVI